VARKGDETRDRPHRLAHVLEFGGPPPTVSREQLEALAAAAPAVSGAPATAPAGRTAPAQRTKFNLDVWLETGCAGLFAPTSPESYKGGQRWIFRTCPWNAGHTSGEAFIIQRADGPIQAGCHHNPCQGKDWHALRDLLEPGWREAKAGGKGKSPGDEWQGDSDWVCDLKEESVDGAWEGWIALGKLGLLAGNPDVGKSCASLDLAARFSRGADWPDGSKNKLKPSGVVVLSAEDDKNDTITPRLKAADAETRHILVLNTELEYVDPETGKKRLQSFNLETHLPILEDAICKVNERVPCRLAIIDPISAFLGGKDSYKDSDVRALLMPLVKLAARYKVSILGITHLNKRVEGDAFVRIMGSVGFTASGRYAYAITKDPANPERRLFLPVKNNLARRSTGLAFWLNTDERGRVRVDWELSLVTVTADEAIAPKARGPQPEKCDEAQVWLTDYLHDGARRAKECLAAAVHDGITRNTLQRARGALGVIAGPGSSGAWEWRLPAKEEGRL
jgi:archaellum biogenesis ATPase FlaH